MKTIFDKFDTSWSKQGVKDRCVKLVLQLTPELRIQLENYIDVYYNCLNWISNKTFEHLLSTNPPTSLYTKGKKIGENRSIDISIKDSKIPADAFCSIYKNDLNKLGLTTSNTRECLCISNFMRYCAYYQRNTQLPKRPLAINSSKGTFIRKIKFDIDKKQIGIPLPGVSNVAKKNKNIYLWIPVTTIYNQKYPIIKELSGNLIYNSTNNTYMFVTRAKLPISWIYSPTASLAIDINKKKENFLVLSDGTKIPRTDKIVKLCETLKTLNQLLNKQNHPEIKTKKRRHIRRAWFNVHRQIKKQVKIHVDYIINRAKTEKLLLHIDPSNTGATNGNYGQSPFISLMIKECEDQGIPFIIVPTPFTTQRCSTCGKQNSNIQKTRQKNPNMQCECGNTIDVDINSAKNISYFGQMIWNHGYEYFSNWISTQNFISKKKP